MTDRQTDRILLAIPRLHYMQRGKNWFSGVKIIVRVHVSRSYSAVFFYSQCMTDGGSSRCVLDSERLISMMGSTPGVISYRIELEN